MNQYKINLLSKNKKSLKNFLKVFFKSCKSYKFMNKNFQKSKKRKVLTILKSPHVNKRAQEQFQYNTYFKNVNFNLPQFVSTLHKIKKIKFNLFSDVTLKTKILINYNLINQLRKKVFNLDNFKLNLLNKKNYKNKKNLLSTPKTNKKPMTNLSKRKRNSIEEKLLSIFSSKTESNRNKIKPMTNTPKNNRKPVTNLAKNGKK